MTKDTSPEKLLRFLESEDPALVDMGVSLAKGSNVKFSAKELENLLNSPDIEKNKIGLSLADESNVGDDAIKILCIPLKDEDEWVRFETVGKLKNIGDSRPTKELIELLREVNGHYAGEPPNQVWRNSKRVFRASILALAHAGEFDILIEAFENYTPPFIGSALDDIIYDEDDNGMGFASQEHENILDMMRSGMEEGERIEKERVEKHGPMDRYNRTKQYDEKVKAKIEQSGTESLTDDEWEFVDEQRDYIFEVQKGIAEVLGKRGDVKALEPLIKGVKDGLAPAPAGDPYNNQVSPKVSEACAIALGNIGDNRAVDVLIWGICLGEDDYKRNWYEFRSAVVALGKIGDVKAVEPIIMKISSAPNEAIEALGNIGDTRAINPIINHLDNPENYCDKDIAVEALKKLGHEISRIDIKCLSSNEPW